MKYDQKYKYSSHYYKLKMSSKDSKNNNIGSSQYS